MFRSSGLELFCNFVKNDTLLLVLSGEFWKIFTNNPFTEHLGASVCLAEIYLLILLSFLQMFSRCRCLVIRLMPYSDKVTFQFIYLNLFIVVARDVLQKQLFLESIQLKKLYIEIKLEQRYTLCKQQFPNKFILEFMNIFDKLTSDLITKTFTKYTGKPKYKIGLPCFDQQNVVQIKQKECYDWILLVLYCYFERLSYFH